MRILFTHTGIRMGRGALREARRARSAGRSPPGGGLQSEQVVQGTLPCGVVIHLRENERAAAEAQPAASPSLVDRSIPLHLCEHH